MQRTAHRSTTPSQPAGDRPSYDVTFVLSGGSARGAIQVGMLHALIERGIVPDFIVGTSVGALNGACLASQPNLEGVRALEAIWHGVRFDDIFTGGPMGVVVHLLKRLPSLYSGDGVRRLVERATSSGGFDSRTFEDLRVPLAVVATNLTRGQPVIFERGPILPALLASCAIPALLPPVELDGEQYVDGGLLDNVGLRVVAARGARRIYVLDTSWDGRAEKPATTLDSVIERSLQVVMAFHLQCALETYAAQTEVVVLRAEGPLAPNGNDFSNTARLIDAGREIAERVLASPERESEQAIQRGRAARRPMWARSPRAAFGPSGQSAREWLDAAATRARASLGTYAQQLSRVFAPPPAPGPLVPRRDVLEAPQQQAS